MADRPLSEGKAAPNWHLAPPHDKRAQGLVVSGFAGLPTGRALFLEFAWQGTKNQGGGGAWLAALRQVVDITDADGRDPRGAAISFTWSGLQKMGLNKSALASFDRPFKEGMFQEDRLRRLGDRREDAWRKTVIEGGPLWSGNTPLDGAAVDETSRAFDDTSDDQEHRIATQTTVHALLLLYEADEDAAEAWCTKVSELLTVHDVRIAHMQPLQLRPDENGVAREHFGFADGISQPIPFEPGAVVADGKDVERDRWNGVPLGEILMGHLNGHNEIAPGPVVADSPVGRDAGLPEHPRGEGFLDLGIDGSYMVVRELKQNVVAFWESMRTGARAIRERDPEGSAHITTDWLAERVVGRDTNGNLLCPAGGTGVPWHNNDFGFFDRDLRGMGCPSGSHVRRGNPRDGLAPTASDKETMLQAANNHRILRRGRKFGTTISVPPKEDGVDRGLLFICLNTDITRQFEFIQQTWILNPNFATLYDETDPLIGPEGTMTVHDEPLRRIIPVDTFVQMAGGEYFFLPSIPALKYLGSL